ncbi:MAG: hypothetical protein ACF8XB_04385 [Planctomycetota bacterium JB042]
MRRRSTFTDVDGRRRIVEWWSTDRGLSIEVQRLDDDGEWRTIADSGERTEYRAEFEDRFLGEHAPWLRTFIEKTRGPIESIESPADERFLVLGTVGPGRAGESCFVTDDDVSAWPVGRFGFQQQYAGHGCVQARIDGAWFPLSSGGGEVVGRLNEAFPSRPAGVMIAPWELGAIDSAIESVLRVEPLPRFGGVDSGEALHLFRPTHEAVSRISRELGMVVRIRDVRRDPETCWFVCLETGRAPFTGLWDLARWLDRPAEELVGALVYFNSD